MKKALCSFLCTTFLLNWMQGQDQDYHVKVVRSRITNQAGQQFLCVAPYAMQDCEKQVVILQTRLHWYQAEKLGRWTWVLVHSEDWKPILERAHRDPDSPAFSILERRQTFFEDVLFVPNPRRRIELTYKWHVGFDQFLDLAVTHELGHSLCHDADERRSDQFGQHLRQGQTPRCENQHTSTTAGSR